jgi:hypothetical protein
MRITKTARLAALWAALGCSAWLVALPAADQAHAQSGSSSATGAYGDTEGAATPRRARPRVRIYRNDERGVYPSYNPGPNAVRECTANLVQEYRPSGTVIVPRMSCYWRRG